jgi:hypothetical protein
MMPTDKKFEQAVMQSLKRMLANGRLTAVPKRPGDRDILVALAAAQVEAHRDCAEIEVNERLQAWLETISEPFGIDHVTLRRMLVDSRFLVRTKSGSTYRVNEDRLEEIEAVRGIDPGEVLARVRNERDLRKRSASSSRGIA